MHSTRRTFLTGAVALGASALGRMAFAADDAFNIGWVRPTTGRLASSYAPLYIGGLIAIDEINAAGGVMGRKIARQEEDDEASPAREPAVIKKLQENGIGYVCGPTGSSQSLAALAVTTPAKTITTMYAIASEAGDGARYPWHYQCTFNSDLQAEMASRYLVETLKLKKIGILQENTAYGEQVVAACQTVLKKLGVTPVGLEVFPITAPDLNGYVGNLRKAGADGVLFWTGSTPITAKGFNSMHAQKYYPAIAGHSALFADSLLFRSTTGVGALACQPLLLIVIQLAAANNLEHAVRIVMRLVQNSAFRAHCVGRCQAQNRRCRQTRGIRR